MHTLDKDRTQIHLIDVVKGLNSEVDTVIDQIKGFDFDVGCIAISKNELEGLKNMIEDGKDFSIEPNAPERIYAENLSKFGEVSLPPPSYIAFVKYCMEQGIKIMAVDMDEEHYTMAYCEHVSGTQWILQSVREKRLKTKKFDFDDPRDFAKAWDKSINKLKGYQDLEEHRESVIAKNLVRISKKGVTLALIEVERVEGVIKNMQDMGWEVE